MVELGKTVAYTCPYVPAEWIAAHGLRPRRLIPLPVEGTSTIPRIEGLCPYARAFVNDVAASKDVDGIVVTTACDQMRRVFDLLVRRVDTPAFLLNVPSTWQTVAAQRLYLDELKRLGRFLVRLGGHEPDKEELVRAMLDQAHGNGVHGTPYHSDYANLVDAGWQRQAESGLPIAMRRDWAGAPNAEPCVGDLGPSSELAAGGQAYLRAIGKAYAEPPALPLPPTILAWPEYYNREGVPLAIVGGPLMQRDRVLFDVVEECGGRIVLDATETGQRGLPGPFDRRRLTEDPLMELAQVYFRIPDASRRPNSELYRWLKDELARAGASRHPLPSLRLVRQVACGVRAAEGMGQPARAAARQ